MLFRSSVSDMNIYQSLSLPNLTDLPLLMGWFGYLFFPISSRSEQYFFSASSPGPTLSTPPTCHHGNSAQAKGRGEESPGVCSRLHSQLANVS